MFKLTEATGSLRYMAPEVMLGKRYNERVDVYSFSILLWRILELDTPFKDYVTLKPFFTHVYGENARPKCNPEWPDRIVGLFQSAWGPPTERPSMNEVIETLHNELDSIPCYVVLCATEGFEVF